MTRIRAGVLDVADRAIEAALTLARRRRIGPFAQTAADRPLRERQLAAMIRAGHGFALARRIVDAAPGVSFEDDGGGTDGCDDDEPC